MSEPRYDLHSHSFYSDGQLLPVEILRRTEVLGHAAVAITDHADSSNLEAVLERLLRLAEAEARSFQVRLIPGVELTHVPPQRIPELARRARQLGGLVVVHGETPVEPVAQGTNRAAASCAEVDILAHPGLLSAAEARLAAEHGVCLEITPRRGHSWGNGRVARLALEAGAELLVNTDAHGPEDYLDHGAALKVALGAGLSEAEARRALVDSPQRLLERRFGPC